MIGVSSLSVRAGDYRVGLGVFSGYVTGTVAAATIVLGSEMALATPFRVWMEASWRIPALVALSAIFGALDLFNRTPTVGRQTPQAFRVLPAFARGLAWGLDVGLLFATVKVTSLVWFTLCVGVLFPDEALRTVATFYIGTIILQAVGVAANARWARLFGFMSARIANRSARMASAVVLIGSGTILWWVAS